MTPSANDLYRIAQTLIREGQPVFPCRSTYLDDRRKAKAPLIKNGLNAASLDRDQVKSWWRKFRDAPIGIPTGIIWDVLDVDVKNNQDGRVHLADLHALGLLNGCKRVVRTPSGGLHLYFKAAQGLTNKSRVTLGLDVRAKGGYVLAPGSYINAIEDPDAGYEGIYEHICDTKESTDEPLLWDLIVSSISPVNKQTNRPVSLLGYERRSSLASLRGWLSERVHGERNNSLHWAVCRCIENGIDPHELVDVAVSILGLGEDEVLLTVNSAIRRAGVAESELNSEAEALFPND